MSTEFPSRRQRRRPSASAPVVGLTVTALVLVLLVALAPGAEFSSLRRLLGLGPDAREVSVEFTPGTGTFAFLQTQRGTGEPVGYDPCRPVDYVVNPSGAPAGWEDLIRTSVEHTEAATGLTFDYVGTTDERPFDPERARPFVGSASPAVIGFADEGEIAGLAGDVAALGGSLAVRSPLGRDYFATGAIALDTEVFTELRMATDPVTLRAILDHEFGHLVGLDHVSDSGELMFRENIGRTTYGPGDLEGLARLGSIPCS